MPVNTHHDASYFTSIAGHPLPAPTTPDAPALLLVARCAIPASCAWPGCDGRGTQFAIDMRRGWTLAHYCDAHSVAEIEAQWRDRLDDESVAAAQVSDPSARITTVTDRAFITLMRSAGASFVDVTPAPDDEDDEDDDLEEDDEDDEDEVADDEDGGPPADFEERYGMTYDADARLWVYVASYDDPDLALRRADSLGSGLGGVVTRIQQFGGPRYIPGWYAVTARDLRALVASTGGEVMAP